MVTSGHAAVHTALARSRRALRARTPGGLALWAWLACAGGGLLAPAPDAAAAGVGAASAARSGFGGRSAGGRAAIGRQAAPGGGGRQPLGGGSRGFVGGRLPTSPRVPFTNRGPRPPSFGRGAPGIGPPGPPHVGRPRAPGHSFHHGGKCFSRHHHGLFAFFFAPLVGFGFAYPYWYDYPYVPEPPYDEPEVFQFEPFYTSWVWYPEVGAFMCRLFVTPEAWLVVLRYADQRGLAYYFDPVAQQYIGALDLSTGEFRHWYGDAGGWGDPEPFPYVPPPAFE